MPQPPWKAWYKLARWRALRRRIFLRDLYTCQRKGCGRVEPDTSLLVCDHVIPHRGDERLFWDEANLQTLCKTCHDRDKQREEQASLHTRGVWD
ncbi:HNH endonuclease [Bradyrhizobium sp. NAS96.2]|uniref:HNH endonuclease n=1 Tax=Bradyrhizobium sp. NAS96.2 TaxID=1680160 RepID=UPI000938CEDB|nr:HNH endonuclease [Bradyrhizobium sp. NAS96.2]OKO67049.1 HNH endonuclease [Bradyrhizobium sp. NAS96.2]